MRSLLVACVVCVASLTFGTGAAQAAQWNPMRKVEEAVRRISEELRPVSRFPEPTCCGGMSCRQAREIERQSRLRLDMTIGEALSASWAVEPMTIDRLLREVFESAGVSLPPAPGRLSDPRGEAASPAGLD